MKRQQVKDCSDLVPSCGRIDYAPDYKSENPELRHAVGLLFQNPTDLERVRLERTIIEAAKAEYEVERTSDRGANTITRTDALIQLQPLMQKRREAVAKLVEFESLQEKE